MIKNIALIAGTCMAAVFFSGSALAETTAVTTVKEVAPVYPKSALERRHTGWAVVRYTVNEDGRAENIEVTDSEPARIFDRVARKAIAQSRFEVTEVEGEPVSIDNQYKKFVFEIDEEIPGDVVMRHR